MNEHSATMTPRPGAEAILQLLEENERNVSWLARKTGRSVSHLFRVLQGERVLTRELAQSIADVFGVDVNDILGDVP